MHMGHNIIKAPCLVGDMHSAAATGCSFGRNRRCMCTWMSKSCITRRMQRYGE